MAPQLKTRKEGAGRSVLYLYGITELRPAGLELPSGVDLESPVNVVECEGSTCWVSSVSAIDFDEALASNMQDLDWLARATIAHQRVLSAIARETEILPARFGTVFHNESSLRKHIRSRLPELKRDFERVRDAEEWGVKVFAAKPAPARLPNVRSGKEYLRAKADLLAARKLTPANGELAEFEDALNKVAIASAPAGSVTRGQPGLSFHASLLVKRGDRKKLESVLSRFSRRWTGTRQIECTGPWPPYSFVSRAERSAG